MQDEKARQRAEDEARRADEEACKARTDASSSVIVRKLQRKRFQQVMQDGSGRGSWGAWEWGRSVLNTCCCFKPAPAKFASKPIHPKPPGV
jgi:hypothetical protein